MSGQPNLEQREEPRSPRRVSSHTRLKERPDATAELGAKRSELPKLVLGLVIPVMLIAQIAAVVGHYLEWWP